MIARLGGVGRVLALVCAGLICAALGAAAPSARGAERDAVMLLVGADLQPRRITLIALDEKAITYSGADRAIQNEPLTQHLQLRATDTPPGEASILARADLVAVRLVDGQVLAGSWVGPAAGREGQVFKLRHPTLGEFEVDLEATAQVAWGGPLPQGPTPSVDRVELVNGDAMSGFVVGVGEAGVELQPAGQPAGQPRSVTLPRDRVRRLHLANPLTAQPPTQALLTFHDGVRVRASAFRVDLSDAAGAAKLRFKSAAWSEERVLPLSALKRIEAPSAAGRLVELADLEMKATGADVFGVELPPIRGARGLTLHAPVVLRFTLPPGAERVSLVAELLPELLPDLLPERGLEAASGGAAGGGLGSSAWAHCVMVLVGGGEELARREITASRPNLTVQVPVKPGPLELRLEAGLNGPIQDRVRLRDAVVLIKP